MHKKRGPMKKDVERMDDGNAFIPDPHDGPAHARDSLAEELAEEFLDSATTAQERFEENREEVVSEELGGPFLEERASMEFANDIDEMNPEDATREPFPTAMRGAK